MMDITLDDKSLSDAVNEAATKAIANGLKGYDVEKALRENVIQTLFGSVLHDALIEAVKTTDIKSIADAISKELLRVVGALAVRSLRESAASALIAMRSQGYVSDEVKARLRAEILASLEK